MDDGIGSRKPPSGRSPKSSRRKQEATRICEEGSDSESDSGHTSRSRVSRHHRRHNEYHHNEEPFEGACARKFRNRKHDLRSTASSPGGCGGGHSSCSDRDLHDWSSYSAGRESELLQCWYPPDWRPPSHTPYGFLGPMGPAVTPCWYPKGEMGYHAPPPQPYWRPIYKPEVEDRLRRLEGEKDSLQMQVSVLMEQIDAQSDKISEMERLLQEKAAQLNRTEELLQKEHISRSQLETQKVELAKELSCLRLRSVSVEKENMLLRNGAQINGMTTPEAKLSPERFARVGSPSATSTPFSSKDLYRTDLQKSPSRGLGGSMDIPSLDRSPMLIKQPRTPPANTFRKVDMSQSMSGTLPKNAFSPDRLRESSRTPTQKRGVAFGKGLNFFKSADKRSCSAPNLAETERADLGEENGCEDSSPLSPETPSSISNLSPTGSGGKSKGLRKLFGRMRRSNSSAFEEPEAEFKRGGVRSTAGPRLGWGSEARKIFSEPSAPFGLWDADTICNWLNDLGLQTCAVEARRWVKRGQQLLDATCGELEKELGLKNPLHKKKLLLALESKGRPINDMLRPFGSPLANPSVDSAAAKLDHNWVVRWLDDVGLPQYKDLFMESKIDGRVLHNLTIDDLCGHLKVTNLLHVTSVRRGIQVLRNHNFSIDCLIRRPSPEESDQPITAAHVALWTNHRVMEWLRTVDLSEYAPNLRGSGVHGALMVFEPKFTAELLASILSIPAGKTLLRRHLTTHFKELVGKDVMQEKRDVETEAGYTPITPLVKAKVVKRGQFTLKRRKSKSEFDFDDLVCPLDASLNKSEEKASPKL